MRDFFRHNLWQKIFSLILAVLIWFTVNAEISLGRGFGVSDDVRQTFNHMTVDVLRNPRVPERFTIDPPEVTVTISGSPAAVRGVSREALEVYVNMVETEVVAGFPHKVNVRAPSSVQVETSPKLVRVQRIADEPKR